MLYIVDVRLRQPAGTPPLDAPQQHGVARILQPPLRRYLDREHQLLTERRPRPLLRIRPHSNGVHLMMHIHAPSRAEAEDRAYAIATLAVAEGMLLLDWDISCSRVQPRQTRSWHCPTPDLCRAEHSTVQLID